MPRISSSLITKSLVTLVVLIAGVIVFANHTHTALAAGGTYAFTSQYLSYDDTWIPCTSFSTPTAFSCNASTVGNSFVANVCRGPGWDVTEYTCTYTPPPASVCTVDTSCAANTCTTSTCTATNADCSTSTIAGTKNCSVACSVSNTCGTLTNTGVLIGSVCSAPPPSEATCTAPPPSCVPNGACTAANTCSGSTCVDNCGTTFNGTMTGGSCVVIPPGPTVCSSPTVTVTASPTRVKSGSTTVLTITGTGLTSSCTLTGTGSGATVNQVLTPTSCTLSPNPTTVTTPPITTQSTFTVTCADIAVPTKIIVNLNPTFTAF
ncbi:MAG: hypothetical protein JWM39_853 [Parcubacteria group bacterium]|nr:hypothetical protein [Parcubacteria group bacterium]